MSFDRHVEFVDHFSQRFLASTRQAQVNVPVPTCPGWVVGDLIFHLAEVQDSWAQVVAGLLVDIDDKRPLPRPRDSELADLFDVSCSRLVSALRARAPWDECWSWSETGGTVEWVARRQHHEAAIHLADLDMAMGRLPDINPFTAFDGVDEMIGVMLAGFPDWMTYTPTWLVELQAQTMSYHLPSLQDPRRYLLTVGSLSGTSPATGSRYTELPSAHAAEYGEPDAIISGPADALDMWLWGRGSVELLSVDGDKEAAEALRAAIADGTQ